MKRYSNYADLLKDREREEREEQTEAIQWFGFMIFLGLLICGSIIL